MASRFQEASLVTSPSYPNAVAWSSENLIAVAAGHLVIILNPAFPSGPRGVISVPNAEPYQIGKVRYEGLFFQLPIFKFMKILPYGCCALDLLTGGLLPSSLKRERHPCVRSLSWSDLGMSQNYGQMEKASMIRPLIVVYGEWLFKDNCWDFVVDNVKGARMCVLSDSATHADLVEMAEEDYKLDMNREVVDFTYSSPEEMMQQMAPDTPPIHVTSDRQVQNLIEICKTHDSQLRDKKKIMKMVMKSQIREKKKIMKMVMKRRRRLMSQFGEVDEDDFVDYSVYGKLKDEDVDEVEADDMCFEGFKALYASEGGSSNMAFSDNIYVNQSFVSREALVSELWLTALKLKFSFKLYKVTKTLVVAKCRVAGCGWKLRAGVKHGTNRGRWNH
ncbi:hypothetical protein F2Q70_00036058 [Brassica cretica]|uniref:Transposase MuDR plant domain-containing protein n=1 Tax=Brassica cretica TaxID=69181 RepID=A0A8S9JRZ7_BRACR|nr:hypothetical protein F2Q70_00036058 [Brassica cretica]